MFNSTELIEFTLENVVFTISDFKHQTIVKPFPLHYHGKNSLEIHYFLGGSGKFIVNEEEIPISKGTFIATGPLVVHGQLPDDNSYIEKISIYMMVKSKKEIDDIGKLVDKPYYFSSNNDIIKNSLLQIENELKNRKFRYKEVVGDYLKIILINLVRAFDLNQSNTKKEENIDSIFQIQQIINNEFKTITITELADRVYMSVRELQRFLLKNFNKNFNLLKMEAKMFYASNRLIYTDEPISDIAETLGYSTSEHFSYAFKKYFSTTPLSYRKNKRGDIGMPEYLNLSSEME